MELELVGWNNQENVIELIGFSPPAWDNQEKKLIYPISPKYQESALRMKLNILLEDDHDVHDRYSCLTCPEFLFPKRGQILRWHFSHYSSSACSSVHEGESENHKLAKFYLCDLLRRKIPITIIGTKCINCDSSQPSTIIEYLGDDFTSPTNQEHPKVEYVISKDTRVDIALVNNGNVKYIFEIFEKNKTKIPRPEPWFEIKAGDVLKYSQEDDVREVILCDVKYYKCCEPIQREIKIEITEKNLIFLGLFEIYDGYSCEARKLVAQAMMGKYIVINEWNLNILKKEHPLWDEIARSKICVKCQKKTDGIKHKPYCYSCYKIIKRGNCKNEIWMSITPEKKESIRNKLSWIRNLPRWWGCYTKCSLCNGKSRKILEPNNGKTQDYVWWFGCKKNICTVCLKRKIDDSNF